MTRAAYKVRGEILHARTHESEMSFESYSECPSDISSKVHWESGQPLENATEHPLENATEIHDAF